MNEYTLRQIYDFFIKTNAAPTVSAVLNALKEQVDVYNCEYMVFAPVTLSAANVMFQIDPELPFIIEFPQDWIIRYTEQGYHSVDPVIEYCSRTTQPFSWDELKSWKNQSAVVKRFWKESEDCGLKYGASFPLHGPLQQIFVLSLSTPVKEIFDELCTKLDEVQLIAYQFYLTYTQKQNEDEIEYSLSPREKEVLQWSAYGKSAWETGKILSISEHTVNTHLKNVVKKLKVTSKTAATAKALKYGLIDF